MISAGVEVETGATGLELGVAYDVRVIEETVLMVEVVK